MLYADGKRATFQYDALGRRTTMVDWDGTTTYAYSARGELTGKTEPTGLHMTMMYDSVGNRTTLTEPDGYSYTVGYDALNRPIRLRNPNAYVYTFQYDAAGRRTTLLDSTGITRLYQYDPVGRLTTQVDSNSGGTGLVTFVDGYDAVGNRVGRSQNGVVTTWVYDNAYRLTAQDKSGQVATFVYDDGGNLTVKWQEGGNPLTMSYDAGNRLTTSIQGASQLTTYGFDNNGNLTSEHCTALSVALTWTYDGENRCLAEQRPSGANHTYTYSPDGLRRSMHQGGSANPVSFVWDGNNLLNEYITGGVAARYDVLDGEVLGHKGGAYRYLYLPDPLGNVVNLLDTSQNIAGTYVYAPYGEVLSHTGADTALQFGGALGYYTSAANRVYDKRGYYRPDMGRGQAADAGALRVTPDQADVRSLSSRSGKVDTASSACRTLAPPVRPSPRPAPPIAPPRPGGQILGTPRPAPGGGIGACLKACVIVAGVEACYELCTYSPGCPTGPFTDLGECLGDLLFPYRPEESAPLPTDPFDACDEECHRRNGMRRAAIFRSPRLPETCRQLILHSTWLKDCYQMCRDGCRHPPHRPTTAGKCFLSWARRHMCDLK